MQYFLPVLYGITLSIILEYGFQIVAFSRRWWVIGVGLSVLMKLSMVMK
jgi:hypothetical protein